MSEKVSEPTSNENEEAPSIGLWAAMNDTPNEPPPKSLSSQNATKFPPTRVIKWSVLNDGLLAFVLLIITQAVIGLGIIMAWAFQNTGSIQDIAEDPDAVTAAVTEYMAQGPGILISALGMYAVWYWIVRRASHKRGLGTLAKDFWLKYRLPRDIALGLGVALVLRAAEFGILSALDALGVDMSSADNSSTIVGSQGIWFFVNAILIASFLGPFMEELFFRGLLLQAFARYFRRLRRPKPMRVNGVVTNNIASKTRYPAKLGNWLAIILSSAIFGLMHYQGFDNFGQTFVVLWTGTLGLIFALMVFKTKRLGPVIFAHIFFNFSGVILATVMK